MQKADAAIPALALLLAVALPADATEVPYGESQDGDRYTLDSETLRVSPEGKITGMGWIYHAGRLRDGGGARTRWVYGVNVSSCTEGSGLLYIGRLYNNEELRAEDMILKFWTANGNRMYDQLALALCEWHKRH